MSADPDDDDDAPEAEPEAVRRLGYWACLAGRLGVAYLGMDYDGAGDEGDLSEVTFYREDGGEVDVEPLHFLSGYLEHLMEGLLPLGWEINDGSHGDMTVNARTGRLEWEHHDKEPEDYDDDDDDEDGEYEDDGRYYEGDREWEEGLPPPGA